MKPSQKELEEEWELVKKWIESAHLAVRQHKWVANYFARFPPNECNYCTRRSYCLRLRANGRIQKRMLQGELCPDAYSIWNTIFR